MSERPPRPGEPGYQGHRTGPGMFKRSRPRTMRNRKELMCNAPTRANWARFKATAGLNPKLEFQKAIRRAKIHDLTGRHWVNGLTDIKLSTAIDFCRANHCRVDRFAAAMIEAWELAERHYQVDEALIAASVEDVIEESVVVLGLSKKDLTNSSDND